MSSLTIPIELDIPIEIEIVDAETDEVLGSGSETIHVYKEVSVTLPTTDILTLLKMMILLEVFKSMFRRETVTTTVRR